ncbi:MAG: hypothetical protein PVI86_08005 [Phycisphaerae bacterium]
MELVEQGVVVPQSALMRRSTADRYGRVPGIPEEELADPDELERQVCLEELGLILAIPERDKTSWIRPALDGDGGVDWGAFGTVDFDRIRPAFDVAKFKADKLREELRDVVIRMSTVSERIKDRRKYLVLKHVRMGLLELDQIVDNDTYHLARHYLRARRIREEIRQLEEVSQRRRQRRVEAFLASVGD